MKYANSRDSYRQLLAMAHFNPREVAMSDNIFVQLASMRTRTYITPEDVEQLRELYSDDHVWHDLLEVIAGQTNLNCEDLSLCAFAAISSDGN